MDDVESQLYGDSSQELSRRWRKFNRAIPTERPDASIGFAASFTVDPLCDYSGSLLLGEGSAFPLIVGTAYNQIVNACLNPEGAFGTKDLEMIVVLFRLEDLADPVAVEDVRAALQLHVQALRQLRESFAGAIVLGLPPRPRAVVEHLTSFARPSPLEVLWHAALSEVAELTQSMPNTFAIDIEATIAELGETASLDYRKEILYRLPYSEALFVRLARKVVRIYCARRQQAKKCIVVDCDNTLWGGIIGEDGVGGVHLSNDHPGLAFVEFQRQLKVLRDSGIFLALASKNNPDDVAEMFETHAGMVLHLNDISVSRINWRPKSENLKEIAHELNIGLESLVFVDDNPFEIDEVRTHAPGVTCIQVPEDIVDLPLLFGKMSFLFDRLEITADDRQRVGMMHQEMQRRELSQKLTEAEFLAGLDLVVSIFEPEPADYGRLAQLINKTNQFNLTTRRYSVEEVVALVQAAEVDVFCAKVTDRFGDYGLVGVTIVRHIEGGSEIDSLLMSCRVLGRGVEGALLSHAISLTAKRGAREIGGSFLPTRKNAMVADFFDIHGFQMTAELPGGGRLYRRATDMMAPPDHLRLVYTRTPLASESEGRGAAIEG